MNSLLFSLIIGTTDKIVSKLVEYVKSVICLSVLKASLIVSQVPEISDQEVPEEKQPARLVACCGQHQGELRATLLPDQSGRGGGRGRRLNPCRSFVNNKFSKETVYSFHPSLFHSLTEQI